MHVSPDAAEDIEEELMIQIGSIIKIYRQSIGIMYDNKGEEIL